MRNAVTTPYQIFGSNSHLLPLRKYVAMLEEFNLPQYRFSNNIVQTLVHWSRGISSGLVAKLSDVDR